MHRHERPPIGPFESDPPLSKPEGQIHELHLRGWQSRADMAAQRLRPILRAVHPRGDRLRAHLSRGRQPHYPAQAADHQGQDSVQAKRPGRRVRTDGHHVQLQHIGATRAERRAQRKRGHLQQLQPVSCEKHQLGRDHNGSERQLRVCLQFLVDGARVPFLRQLLRGRMLGRGSRKLPTVLQSQLQSTMLTG